MVGKWRSVDTDVMATMGSYGVFTWGSIPLVGPKTRLKSIPEGWI